MVEGITSRAFINSNLACTPTTTVNANIARVATITATKAIVSTEFQSEIRQANNPPAGSQAYQYSLVEPINAITENLVRVKNAVRTISEPAKAITESLVKKVTHQLSQTTAITEGLTRAKTANRPIVEPPNAIGDSLNKIAHKVRTISEPASTIGESLDKSKLANRSINESAIAITDSIVKHAIKNRQITEPATNITETLLHLKASELGEAPITVTELLEAKRILSRSISESVFISGVVESFAPTSFDYSFTNSISSTENLVKKVTHNIPAEVTTITENLVKVRIAVRNLSETVPLQPETVQRLVTHYLNEPVTNITESLIALKIFSRTISETVPITESLAVSRHFRRSINPQSFTDASFTTGAFESFNIPSGDVTEITEELEGFILPPGVFNLIEPAIDITESLVSAKTVYRTITEDPITIGESLTGIIPIPVPTTGGGGANRRRIRRARYNAYLKSLQPVKIPVPEPEPEHEPLIFEVDITEPPIAITEALVPLKTVKEKVIVSVAAAAPPPQIIEKEVEKLVYVDRIKEVEKEIQPPPIIKAQDVIVSKPKPIEIEQEILVSTQSHSNKMKSRAASAKLQILQELMTLAEMEEMV